MEKQRVGGISSPPSAVAVDLQQLWLMCVYGAYTVSLTVLSRQGVCRAATVVFVDTYFSSADRSGWVKAPLKMFTVYLQLGAFYFVYFLVTGM